MSNDEQPCVLARSDPGLIALRAVMPGNITLHVLGSGIDVYRHSLGFVRTSGAIMGAVLLHWVRMSRAVF